MPRIIISSIYMRADINNFPSCIEEFFNITFCKKPLILIFVKETSLFNLGALAITIV